MFLMQNNRKKYEPNRLENYDVKENIIDQITCTITIELSNTGLKHDIIIKKIYKGGLWLYSMFKVKRKKRLGA